MRRLESAHARVCTELLAAEKSNTNLVQSHSKEMTEMRKELDTKIVEATTLQTKVDSMEKEMTLKIQLAAAQTESKMQAALLKSYERGMMTGRSQLRPGFGTPFSASSYSGESQDVNGLWED